MNIVIITEEDEFYIPLAIDAFIKNCQGDVIEAVIARNPLLPGKFAAAKKFYKSFGLWPVAKHAFRLLKAKMFDKFDFLNNTGRYFSVEGVCNANNIKFSYEDNINSESFLSHLKDVKTDLIASISPTQIFKEKLIELPEFGCLNIHTAKLPKYRGLYPTYWAMANGENVVGISIHFIEKGIDTGDVIVQDEIVIPPEATLHEMLHKSKLKGGKLLAEAARQIENGTSRPFKPQGEGSYFSFPTRQSFKDFKSFGYKLW